MIATVVIPTHNRADSIVRTVRSLFEQRVSGRFEVIVVDNASRDGTFERVSALTAEAPFALRVLREEELGVHNARHTGARAASADLLLYTDDDLTFVPDWLDSWVRAFRKHPDMAAAGGPVDPAWEAPPPQWLQDYMSGKNVFSPLATVSRGDQFLLEREGIFFSCNMAIRRETLFRMGGFNPEAFGKVWIGDGETGLNNRLWAAQQLIGWVPEALAYHHIPKSRTSLAYLRRRSMLDGSCDIYQEYRGKRPRAHQLVLRAFKSLREALRPWARMLRVVNRDDPNAVDAKLTAVRYLGQMRYIWWLLTKPYMRQMIERTDWLTQSA